MLKMSVMMMAVALFAVSVHAADPAPGADAAGPASASEPERAASAKDAPGQNPADEALSAMFGPLTPEEKPAAASGVPASAVPADARPDAGRQSAAQAEKGRGMWHGGSEQTDDRHAKSSEARRLGKGHGGAAPGSAQQIDWQARRAEHEAKRTTSDSNHGGRRYGNPQKKSATDAAQ